METFDHSNKIVSESEIDDFANENEADEFRSEFDFNLECAGIPSGKSVLLRHDYQTDVDYCNAVVHSIHAFLCNQNIPAAPQTIRDGATIFSFNLPHHGTDVDCFIIIDYTFFTFRFEFIFNIETLPGRTPLIDYFCQDVNFFMRYGSFTSDHSDSEMKIQYSSSFRCAFSEEAFLEYWDALYGTFKAFADDYTCIASCKQLTTDQKHLIFHIISDLTSALPLGVKPGSLDKIKRISEIFGNSLSTKGKKILNLIIELENS